jgi:hypothetical protein
MRQPDCLGSGTRRGSLQASLPQAGESPHDDGESGESPQEGEAKLDRVRSAAESPQEVERNKNQVDGEHQRHQNDDLAPETLPHAVSSDW